MVPAQVGNRAEHFRAAQVYPDDDVPVGIKFQQGAAPSTAPFGVP